MEGHVDLGIFFAHPDQALLELLETAEDVAVVGPKAGEVDVGEEEHTLGDPQPAMACSVAGQMHRLDRYATEIPHGAVGVALGIRTRLVVELLEVLLLEVGMLFRRGFGERHQRLNAASDREVIVMDVDPGIGERTIPGDVVFMSVTVDHRIDRRLDPEVDHRDRRIDDHRFPPWISSELPDG